MVLGSGNLAVASSIRQAAVALCARPSAPAQSLPLVLRDAPTIRQRVCLHTLALKPTVLCGCWAVCVLVEQQVAGGRAMWLS